MKLRDFTTSCEMRRKRIMQMLMLCIWVGSDANIERRHLCHPLLLLLLFYLSSSLSFLFLFLPLLPSFPDPLSFFSLLLLCICVSINADVKRLFQCSTSISTMMHIPSNVDVKYRHLRYLLPPLSLPCVLSSLPLIFIFILLLSPREATKVPQLHL